MLVHIDNFARVMYFGDLIGKCERRGVKLDEILDPTLILHEKLYGFNLFFF